MLTAKLIDNVWATRNSRFLKRIQVHACRSHRRRQWRWTANDRDDNIRSAGIGDRVIVCTGSSARRMLGDDSLPVDAVVVGIIDEDCNFG